MDVRTFYVELEGVDGMYSFIAYEVEPDDEHESTRKRYIIKNREVCQFLRGRYSTHIGYLTYINNKLHVTKHHLQFYAYDCRIVITFSDFMEADDEYKAFDRKIKILNVLGDA